MVDIIKSKLKMTMRMKTIIIEHWHNFYHRLLVWYMCVPIWCVPKRLWSLKSSAYGLYSLERTNIPLSSAYSWTPFHPPLILSKNRMKTRKLNLAIHYLQMLPLFPSNLKEKETEKKNVFSIVQRTYWRFYHWKCRSRVFIYLMASGGFYLFNGIRWLLFFYFHHNLQS